MEEDEDIVLEETEGSYAVEDQKSEYVEDYERAAEYVKEKFNLSKNDRLLTEKQWLQAYRNFRGLALEDSTFTKTEKSKVSIKVTKTKVLAAYGQISEVVLGGEKYPLTVDPTSVPEGTAEVVHFTPGDTGDEAPTVLDMDLEPGDTRQSLMERLGALKEKLSPLGGKLKEGPGVTPEDINFHPAQASADKMGKKIQDGLEESHAKRKTQMLIFECALLGTGVMKGPYAYKKEYARWNEEGEYDPVFKTVPMLDHVSVWQTYPDPDADAMTDAEWMIQRHKLSRSAMRKLKNRPFFRENVINEVVKQGENYRNQWWETALDEEHAQSISPQRFEVLEFWGNMDTEIVEEWGVSIPSSLSGQDQVSVNAWVCGNRVIRLVLNPFKPTYLPYYAVPYELNPYSFFGVGVGENMKDTQRLMDGFMRLAVDNAALSGNLVFEIDEDSLTPGQDLEIYPGKVFKRHAGAPGQALFGTEFPNVSNQNMQLFDKARQLADESTGIPSFSHGQTGVQGIGRTSSGISMLLGAASQSIKTVIRNMDEYLFQPLGQNLFHFYMQFDPDPEIKGDLEIKARGTDSLMAKEVRSQRLMQFLQVTQGQPTAPFAKTSYILREIAKTLELDPDKTVNSMEEAALQAELMAKMQGGTQEGPTGPETGAPALPGVQDTSGTGGGAIGIGQSPLPQEQGFTGNEPQGVS